MSDTKQTTALAKPSDPARDIVEKMSAHMAEFLPAHIGRDRFARMVLGVIRRSPELLKVPRPSLSAAMLEVARLGLEPGKEVYIIPFAKGGKLEKGEAQIIIDYKGKARLALQSGMVAGIQSGVVRVGDFWEYERGLTPKLRHVPKGNGTTAVTHVYAVVHTTTGGVLFEARPREWINENKERDTKPWHDHWEAMARKAVLHEVLKLAPQSPEMQRASEVDGALFSGLHIDAAGATAEAVYSYEGEDVTDDVPPAAERREGVRTRVTLPPGDDRETLRESAATPEPARTQSAPQGPAQSAQTPAGELRTAIYQHADAIGREAAEAFLADWAPRQTGATAKLVSIAAIDRCGTLDALTAVRNALADHRDGMGAP